MSLSIKFDKEGFLNFFDCNTSSFDLFKGDVMWAIGLLISTRKSSAENWGEEYVHLSFYNNDENYNYYKTDSINLLRLIAGLTIFLPYIIIRDILLIIMSAILLPFVVLYNLKIAVK